MPGRPKGRLARWIAEDAPIVGEHELSTLGPIRVSRRDGTSWSALPSPGQANDALDVAADPPAAWWWRGPITACTPLTGMAAPGWTSGS